MTKIKNYAQVNLTSSVVVPFYHQKKPTVDHDWSVNDKENYNKSNPSFVLPRISQERGLMLN
jgi:hypothetical protein